MMASSRTTPRSSASLRSTPAHAPQQVDATNPHELVSPAGTPEACADLALRELERGGGFDRAMLPLGTPTGTGWTDPAALGTVEYLPFDAPALDAGAGHPVAWRRWTTGVARV